MARKLSVAVATLVVTLLGSSCSTIHDQLQGTQVPADRAPASSRGPGPILETTSWGLVDGMLSVVVRNTTHRTLRFANAVVTARTADDQLIASSLEYDERACCEVHQLDPGQQYGLYVDVGPNGSRIAQVDVAYRNVTWGRTTTGEQLAVTARPVGLHAGERGTVVLADLTSRGPEARVVAQAFLTDRAGDLVAVVSGRWICLRPGRQQLRMQLFHPVPAGTQVHRVLVHPVGGDPEHPAPRCGSAPAA